MAASPIFIVGANRSGTTLLRLVLNAHPRIAIPEELIYFRSTMADVPVENWADPSLPDDTYAAFVRQFIDQNCEPLSGLDRDTLINEVLKGPHDFREPYRRVLEAWAAAHGKERWGEKTPGNLFFVDILLEMFPDAKFIHLVRDPRACVSSMNRASFFSSDTVLNALNWRKYVTQGDTLLEGIPSSQYTTLRYEDLVDTPESCVRALCKFLEEDFDPGMLRFHRDAERYMKAEAANSFNSAATRPISDSMISKWKAQLNRAEIALIEWICADAMTEHGYTPIGPPLRIRDWPFLLVKQGYWLLQTARHSHVREYTVHHEFLARVRGHLRTFAQPHTKSPTMPTSNGK